MPQHSNFSLKNKIFTFSRKLAVSHHCLVICHTDPEQKLPVRIFMQVKLMLNFKIDRVANVERINSLILFSLMARMSVVESGQKVLYLTD